MATKTVTEKTTFVDSLKSQWISVLAIVIFVIFMLFTGFKGCSGFGKDGNDTVRVETHTEYIPQAPVVIPQYIPVPSNSTPPVIIPPSYQPAGDYAALLAQYQALVNKHLTTNNYDEAISLKDSTGTEVAKVAVKASVSENEMKTFGPNTYTLNLPHTYTTITLREPPKRQLSVGGGLIGTPTSFLSGGYVGATYKNKKDQHFDVNAGLQSVGGKFQPVFQLGTKFTLKFGKQ